MDNDVYYQKYLKYKSKYLQLKDELYGAGGTKKSGFKIKTVSVPTSRSRSSSPSGFRTKTADEFVVGAIIGLASSEAKENKKKECEKDIPGKSLIKDACNFNATEVEKMIQSRDYSRGSIGNFVNKHFGDDKSKEYKNIPKPTVPPTEEQIASCVNTAKKVICNDGNKYNDELTKLSNYLISGSDKNPKTTGGDPVDNMLLDAFSN